MNAIVVVVGAGGNIGSHLVPHLGRMPGVGQVTLIDRDVYEPKNVQGQDITPRDVGKSKARVQARRLERINSALRVTAIADAVENVPLARLRGAVILACLDSRRARQYVNQAAWRLGAPWIDAGVEAGGWLARVNVYDPGSAGPCLECAWDERDYAAIEQDYACSSGAVEAPPTGAPSSLGALAASLQAMECQKVLEGRRDQMLIGKQVVIEGAYHHHYVTAFRRNPRCRFSHQVWPLERRPRRWTLGEALDAAGNGAAALRVAGQPFVGTLRCAGCGRTRQWWRLRRELYRAAPKCPGCGARLAAAGFDLLDYLTRELAPDRALSRPLARLGVRPGDVVTLSGESGETHYEITDERM